MASAEVQFYRTTRNSKEGDIMVVKETQPTSEEKCTCSHSGEAEIRACTKPCCRNIGHEILKKQGWTAGRGLGKNLQGPVDAPPLNQVHTQLSVNQTAEDVSTWTTESRRLLECEREPTAELTDKYREKAELAHARQQSVAPLKSHFYCDLCDKQYLQHTEYDNHVNSYDHAHTKRQKEAKAALVRKQLGALRQREEKTLEKDIKRITEYAEAHGGTRREGVDSNCTTVFYDDDTPDMPPLPVGINIMDTVCTDTIPLPPDPNQLKKSDSSLSPDLKDQGAQSTTVSFALRGKQTNALPGQSIFKEEEESRKLSFPKRRKALAKKPTHEPLFVPKSEAADKEKAEKEAEELLYPSGPVTTEDGRPKPRFQKMTFVQASENLGGAKAEPVQGPANKPDLLQFVQVTQLEDDGVFDWPAEMVQNTRLSPALTYSCNPLKFDFGALVGKPKAKPTVQPTASAKKEKKKKKSSKKHKKSRSRSTKRRDSKTADQEEPKAEVESKGEKSKSSKKKKRSKSKKKKSKKAVSESESEAEKEESTSKPDKLKSATSSSKKAKKPRKKSRRTRKSSGKKVEQESDAEEEKNMPKDGPSQPNVPQKPETPKKPKAKGGKKSVKAAAAAVVVEGSDGSEAEDGPKQKKAYRKRTNSAVQHSGEEVKSGNATKKKKLRKKSAAANAAANAAPETAKKAGTKGAAKRSSVGSAGAVKVVGQKRIKMEPEDGGRVSDFEGASSRGQAKWETSSDSELENIVKSETKKKVVRTKTSAKTSQSKKAAVAKPAGETSGRSRRDSEMSGRRSSRRSRRSSTRSRSYSDDGSYDSYYTYSSRSRSSDSRSYYTSDSYYSSRSRSRSYRSRSSRSRSYSRSSRSRSYSRGRSSRSYSRGRSYSRSSRSYTRSRSRSRRRTRSRSRRRDLRSSPDPRFASFKRQRQQNNRLRNQLRRKNFKPGPINPMGVNGKIPSLMDKIIPKPGSLTNNAENEEKEDEDDPPAVPNSSALKVNLLEGDRPRPELSEEEKKAREKLIQDIAARMEKEAEEAERAIKDKVASVTKPETIPIPAPQQSATIPLPSKPKPDSKGFIGPVQPGTSNIPLPSTENFQYIGPNDPLVFKASRETGSPSSDKKGEGKAGATDGKGFVVPPEEAQKYQKLQDQVRKHIARQRGEVVESSGDEDEEEPVKQELVEGTPELEDTLSPSVLTEEQLLAAQLQPQLVPLVTGGMMALPQAGQPVMVNTSQAAALAQAQQVHALQQAQLVAQVQAAQQQAAQAQLAAQIQQSQQIALAQQQVLVQAPAQLVQTPHGLMRAVPQAQVVTGAQLQQLQLQRALAAQQQQQAAAAAQGGAMLMQRPMLVRLQRPM